MRDAKPEGIRAGGAIRPATSTPAARRARTDGPSWPFPQRRAVIVRRISIDGVNVIGAALLRRVFDQHLRSLDPEIRGLAVRRGSRPCEIRVTKMRLDRFYFRPRRFVVEDVDPF